ncbi:MAG: hypothetical protein RPR91_07840, partial [Colwellia sp.]
GLIAFVLIVMVIYILLRSSFVSGDVYMMAFTLFIAILLLTNAWLEYVEFCVVFYLGLACFLTRHQSASKQEKSI